MAIDSAVYQTVATAISAYARERWVHARLHTGTGLVSGNVDIDPTGEGFTGQLRWIQEFNAVVNIPTTSGASTDGSLTDISTEIADYIKCTRAFGAAAPNMAEVITRRNGLIDFSERFVESQAKSESEAIASTIRGVTASEVARGTSGGLVQFSTDADNSGVGAFVDINAAGLFGTAATSATDERKLIQTGETGAGGVARLFQAVGMYWKDYEPDFFYMIAGPEMIADLRQLNLVDDTTVTEGNITFSTILNGKFRLLNTRQSMGNYGAESTVNDRSTKTTIIAAPGAVSFVPFPVPEQVEFERSAQAYQGGGRTMVWYRYGFVVHANGYDWSGGTSSFPSDTDLATAGSWTRKAKALNLGILPILHA